MKKLTLSIIFVLISVCGYAQSIKFNGVPLGIGIEKFETLLEQKGYEVVDKTNEDPVETRNMTYYTGVFAGSKVYLSVMSTPISKLVQVVSASLTDFFTSESDVTELTINRKFNEIKASLDKKYPNAKKSNWSEGYITKAHMLESSKWQINLSIQEHDGIKGLHIMYVDKGTSATAKREYDTDY